MSATITNWDDWTPDAQHITFGKANKNQYGSYNMGLRYNGERLYLRTPKMRCPFGLSRGYEDKGYNVQLCFDNDDQASQVFLQKFLQFDSLVRSTGVANAFDWKITKTASEQVHEAVVNNMFKPCVKYPVFKQGHPQAGERNPEYPPYLQINLLETKPKDTDVYPEGHERAGEKMDPEIMTELYDTKQQPLYVDEESITKQCHLTGLIYATSAYKSTTGFGVVWRAAQFMVYPRKGLKGGVCHIPTTDFDEDDEFSAVPQAFGAEEKTVPVDTPVSADATATVTAAPVTAAPVSVAPVAITPVAINPQ